MTPLWHNDNLAIWQTKKDSFDDQSLYGFNVAMHVGDVPSHVLKRRALLLAQLSPFGVDELIWVNQIHSSRVHYPHHLAQLINADAIVSQNRRTGLCIMTADCVPIALFDAGGSSKTTIGCIHAGHQGLSQGVIANTVQYFDTPRFAYIGACIGARCYELPKALADTIVAGTITNALNDETAWSAIRPHTQDKVWLDVGMLARLQLEYLGVTILNETQPCSYHQNYHSHRHSSHTNIGAGRMAMVIAQR